MAKEIKVIKCPQCGSTEKTEIKPDFYRCNNCQTEYFLDNDDVTINYNHNYNHNNNPQFNTDSTRKAVKVISIIFGVFIFLIVLTNVISAIFSSKRNDTSGSAYSSSVLEKEEETGFTASRYRADLFIKPSTGKPVVLVIEDRDYRSETDKPKEGIYISFYDPIDKKLIGEHKLGGSDMSSSSINIRHFTDGNIYVNADKTSLYVVDKEALKLNDAGKKFFAAKTELQVGVATLEFVYEDNGDGLVLLTNDGKKLYYYPLIQKLYNEKEYYNARKGFNTLIPGAKDKVIHVFTSKSSDYPDETPQLIKLTYKDNGAGPKDVVDNLSWGKDYGGSGIFTDADPYKKVLFSAYTKQADRIINWKDVTPGRLYFNPDVVLDEGSTLLISFKPDANPNSGFKLQQINATSGAVEWTIDQPKEAVIKKIIKYKDGYIGVTDNEETIFFDAKGKITANYKIV